MPSTSQQPEDYELLLPSNPDSAEPPKLPMGQEEGFMKAEGRNGDAAARNVALAGALTILTTTWITVLSNNPTAVGWFAFHPLLQTLAIFLFVYGILTLQPTSQPRTKAAGLARHQTAILLIGFPSIFLGTLAVSYNKWLRDANHFTTWHGKFGLLSMIWLFIQIFLGAGSVWFNGAAFGGGAKAKAIWKYHRLSGYVLFLLLLLTVHLGGGWSNWGAKYSPLFIRIIAYTVAPVMLIGGIYTRVRPSKMQFF
ncbi:hypothetical protein BDQ12DRAFT_719608 [Crucibulum laeve]|uniref:Cytochrome b561 domain-containing protein n=1 Tax=Crucibulum laeve TaxID=68775 RepID=A0A5C3MBF1_9AGAR|nr:hypothetical protein BDQ12DRAFT_719608 [Crucibulum laeve]